MTPTTPARARDILAGLALALALTLQVPRTAAAQEPLAPPANPKVIRLHELLQAEVDRKRIAGAVGLVAREGKVVFLDAVGSRDVEAKVPMTTDTVFRIASMSKVITSTAAMILAEEGKLSLADPVSKFLPAFKSMTVAVPDAAAPGGYRTVPAGREVTIRDLLTHTSGISYGFFGLPIIGDLYAKAGVVDGLARTDLTPTEAMRRLASVPLSFQPGQAWGYGLSTDVLGCVVEAASGMTLADFFERRIFLPLGMRDTHFDLPAAKRGRLAAVYQPKDDGTIERARDGEVRRGPVVYSTDLNTAGGGRYYSGGAGLVSTVRDYFRFLEMIRNEGELDGVEVLGDESVRAMTRDQVGQMPMGIQVHGDGFGYGFGVETGRKPGLAPAGTVSWSGFYYTDFRLDPAAGVVTILMSQMQPWGDLKVRDEFVKAAFEAAKPD